MSESRPDQPASNTASEQDRRIWPRAPESALSGVKAQLAAGADVVLKDLSRGGARFQSETRLLPGLTVALRLVTSDGVITVRGRVVRSRMVRIDTGGMGYEVGVAFNELINEVVDAMAESAPAEPSAATVTADASLAALEPGAGPKPDDDLEPMMLTASVTTSALELRELFNGNDW